MHLVGDERCVDPQPYRVLWNRSPEKVLFVVSRSTSGRTSQPSRKMSYSDRVISLKKIIL
jgi:hypothetical protein